MVGVPLTRGLIAHSFRQLDRRQFFLGGTVKLTLCLILEYNGLWFGVVRVDHTPLFDLRESITTTPARK